MYKDEVLEKVGRFVVILAVVIGVAAFLFYAFNPRRSGAEDNKVDQSQFELVTIYGMPCVIRTGTKTVGSTGYGFGGVSCDWSKYDYEKYGETPGEMITK